MSDELEIEQEDGEEGALDKLKKIKENLKQCQKEKTEYLAGWQRAQADMINFKRRQEEQMGEWLKMFGEGLVRNILPVLDSLETARPRQAEGEAGGIRNDESEIKSQELNGLVSVKKQLSDILKKHGLEEIKSVGEKFDPEFHEAIEQVESDKEEGTVAEEIQKGYLLNGKVIRPSKVRVSK